MKLFKSTYRQIELKHILKEWYYMIRYLRFFTKKSSSERIGVALIDGRVWHGGMCDRFKGIISFFNYCRSVNIPFKIYYSYPFNLTDYLIPNKYDWRINVNDIPDSIWNCRPFIATAETGRRLLRLVTGKHILYYGNRDLSRSISAHPFNTNWGVSFNYLFKPAPSLQKEISNISNSLGKNYIAIVFRFQNLLGDFKEYKFKELTDDNSKEKLINKCTEVIEEIHQANPSSRILVTSDSKTFLDAAEKQEFTYIIKGNLVHMDNANKHTQANNNSYMKSFLDFFMIANAQSVYSIVVNDMYPSEFPEYAAKVNNRPFHRLTFNI